MAHPHAHPESEPRSGPGPELDPAQDALVRSLRASFNILRLLMVVLVVLYLFSGIFRVQPDQWGLVSRFGALRSGADESAVFQPGWHWALPDPFDQKYTVSRNVLNMTSTAFMFDHAEAATARNLAEILFMKESLDPGLDGAMLTGDRNLSHGRWTFQYEITDPARFVQNVGPTRRDFEPLLQRLAGTAIVTEVASRTVEEVTREAIDTVRAGVHGRLQALLDELETGVNVVDVLADTIEPGAVRNAFLDVTRAENEMRSEIERARERRAEILGEAAGSRGTQERLLALIRAYGAAQIRGADNAELFTLRAEIDDALLQAEQAGAGDVAVILREARAAANQISERVRQEYEEFVRYLELRSVQPQIALLDVWNDMRDAILNSQDNEIFFVPDASEIEILVNRDPMRQVRRQQEEAQRRMSPGGGEPRRPGEFRGPSRGR